MIPHVALLSLMRGGTVTAEEVAASEAASSEAVVQAIRVAEAIKRTKRDIAALTLYSALSLSEEDIMRRSIRHFITLSTEEADAEATV